MTTRSIKVYPPVAVVLLAIALTGNVFAHGEGDIFYVAEGGTDAGHCTNEREPCATIGYALKFAGKGGTVRVAEGTYTIDESEHIFQLVSGIINVSGGFKKQQKFENSKSGVSILIGVPFEYRELLKERGFLIVADRKGLDDSKATEATDKIEIYRSLKSSIPATPCVNGMAGLLPCNDVDLLSHVGFNEMSGNVSAGADVWGFVDLNTRREYAIAGFNTGTAIFDVTNAENPREVGFIEGQDTVWRDIKVYQFFDAANDRWKSYAYVTTDGSTDGLFVIDMSGLPHSVARVNYASDILKAHNVYATNTDYATGLSLTGDTPELIIAGSNIDNGVYRSYTLASPESPAFVAGGTGSGYMHDASSMIITDGRMNTQCVNATTYCQVLLDFNETSFELWDVTNSADPVKLSDTSYPNVGYVHSGWWSEDKQYIFVHDEFDEYPPRGGSLNTTLRAFSVSDLANPNLAGTWTGPTTAIDHNGYVRGNRYYMSNYSRGLTVLDISDPAIPLPAGRLDTFPVSDTSNFVGAWGAFPFFFSGNVAISDIDSGFYMAQDNTRDVPQGSFSFAAPAAAVEEGQQVQIAVQRSSGSTGDVSVNYELLAATAQSDDYVVTSGVLNWGAGDAADKTIDVTATNDGVGEGIEQVIVRLISPGGGATLANLSTSSLYISDPGAASNIGFTESAIGTTESGYGTLLAVIKRRGTALGAASVDYSMTGGDADPGIDFQGATSGTVSWAAGDGDPKVLEFILNDDGVDEFDEFFELTLSNPGGATIAGSATLTATIRDGGAKPAPPPPTPPPPTPQPSGGGSGAFGGLFLIGLGLLGLRRKFNRMDGV